MEEIMEKRSKKLLSRVIAAVAMTVGSCAFPFQNAEVAGLSDISGRLGFYDISRQGFMGGSVLYNPDQPSSGQLVEGAIVAVRLGRVTVEYHDDIPIFSDIGEEARYGYITINSIDKEHSAFTYTEYSADGKTSRASLFTLRLNEEVDMNGDGVNDLTYVRPLRKRPGFEEAVYLTFISSQEDLRTAMFAVLPEQYSRGVYPSGLMGINPNDKWLVSKYEGSTTTRAAVRGVSKGDYVLDAQRGEYQRFVGSGAHYRSARSVDESDLAVSQTDEGLSFYFSQSAFQGSYSAKTLFNALPDRITSRFDVGQDSTEADFIRYLNEALEYTDLVAVIMAAMEPETPQTELDAFLSQAELMTKDDLVKLNRLLLEKIYEEDCPTANTTGSEITEILPLASVNIADPEAEPEEETDRHARGVVRAADYDDYKSKKAAIDKKFSAYIKFDELVRTLPDYKKKSDAVETPITQSGTVVKIKQPAKLVRDNTILLQAGVHGIFQITWGSIRAGLVVALYMNGETGITASKSFLDIQSKPEQLFKETIDMVNIPLKIFETSPITIGVIYIKVSMNGVFKLPVSIYATGNITTTMYAGFTGLYAAGFEVKVDYGIKTKKVKILWITIGIPVPYLSVDPKGVLVDDLAWYIGPVGDVYTGVKLQSAKFGFICEPSISFGPTVSICDTVYGGVSVGPTLELGYEIGTLTNAKTSAITGIYGDIITGIGLDARYNYELKVYIPLILPKGLRGEGLLKRLVGIDRKPQRVFTKYF
jgi:hypothetical protein